MAALPYGLAGFRIVEAAIAGFHDPGKRAG